MPRIAMKIVAVEEDAIPVSTLLASSQFASTWLPINDADSKKVINQKV
jgi:hypothetical protein